MSIGNFTAFKAKHVDGIIFGRNAWTAGDVTNGIASTAQCLNTSFAAINTANTIDLSGANDALNPTKSYAFAKDFTESGNEKAITDEPMLGVDGYGVQNTEIGDEAPSSIAVEFTVVYRNPNITSLFSDNTKACLIKMDNSESSTTGVLYMAYNNIIVTHAGSLTRNSNGNMEQKVKFYCRGGTAADSFITVSDAGKTYAKLLVGRDKVEEIRTA
jgi:hypothetical protein